MPELTTRGITLHYEVQGEGPPLLLIAGLGANHLSWAPAVPLLADRFTCISFDNRGTGRSSAPPGPYGIDMLADDAAALIEHLGFGAVPAVGWSMGGSILQSLLLRHADRLTKAVLLSTLPSYTALQHAWLDGMLALRRAGVGAIAEAATGLPWAFTPMLLSDHVRTAQMLELGARNPWPTQFEGFAAQAAAIRVYDARPQLHAVRTPTLVLVGAEDVLTPVAQSVEIAERIPGARLQVLPRGGHAMLAEYPAETVAAMRAFLA